MGKAKGVGIGLGIVAGVLAIFASYLLYQESAERDYVNEINRITSDLDKITNEVGTIASDISANRISLTQAKFRVSSLANDVDRLYQHASSMNVPDKYKSAHPHLIRGLDYYTRAMQSTRDSVQYTDNAIQASQQLETDIYTSIIGAIFGFGSLPSLSGVSDVYSNTEAAKAAYNDAIRYSSQAEQELQTFRSLAQQISKQPLPFPIPK